MWSYYNEKKNKLTPELFENPTASFRGTPFWAWNCELNPELLTREIDCFKEMGMGGFHIHVRTGLRIPYLGKVFMDYVKQCIEKAKQENMLCWLYDEDRWPSGTAGGYVTKNENYKSRHLLFTPYKMDEQYCESRELFLKQQDKYKGYYIAKFKVVLENGFMTTYHKLDRDDESQCDDHIWWVYMEIAEESPWYNHQAYVNTLDKDAIDYFINLTHALYHREIGQEFGKSVPAIFTDEPQFPEKQSLQNPYEKRNIILPYTDDFDDTYFEIYHNHISDYLPELLWQLPDNQVSLARYRYHEHLCERFTQAFADNIGNWCSEHDIMLTGHMMEERSLHSQTKSLGEAMRSYRSFQLPGMDVLCNSREFTTAKQVQSASRQFGRPGVICEMYGVTNWDFDFKGHKLGGDWLAALGVTTRVHHLSWVSMAGENKRDYPASIGYQSPWYKEYSFIEDYFSRINTALTRGKAKVRVGVIHPIESYWLYWGTVEQTSGIRDELEEHFQNITQWLLFGLIDFDFIAESLLPELVKVPVFAPIKIGEMMYDVIVIPGCITLRQKTTLYLEQFQKQGGKIIFMGDIARYIDGVQSDRVHQLAKKCTRIPFSKNRILETLYEYRDIEIKQEDGNRTNNIFYQMREDGNDRWLFICHVYAVETTNIIRQIFNHESDGLEKIIITVKGRYRVTLYDTISGQINIHPSLTKNGCTEIRYEFYNYDSILFLLEPVTEDRMYGGKPKIHCQYENSRYLEEPVKFHLSEPNVLLLDMAEYQLDDNEWMPKEELLRIDESIRWQLGYQSRTSGKAQPWVESFQGKTEHLLRLKYRIDSAIKVKNPILACEYTDNVKLYVNKKRVELKKAGYYVDESIHKYPISDLEMGENELILEIPFSPDTDIEWSYLLGDFGVELMGSNSKIIDAPETLFFSNWVNQKLPFYSGNVTYECHYESDGSDIMLEIPHWSSPVLKIAVDGKKMGNIAFEPNRIRLGSLSKGMHLIQITVYGNRFNSFGAVHNTIRNYQWYGPNAWRTQGVDWSYQYQLREMGVLTTPRIYY